MVFATFVGVLLAGAPGWAKTYKFCQGGGVVESGSPLGKKLYAKPSADALGVFGKVKDPVNCSFAKDPATNLTDYTQPEACAEICAERRATLGDLVSCINDSVESSLAMSANAYRQFAAGSAGLPIVFLMPSGPQPDVTQILRSPPAKRSLLQVSFGSKPGDDVAIDVSSPKWDVKWGEVVSKAATACSTAPPAKPARNCAKLGEAANRFAAKLKLLERSAALQELLQAEAGGDAAGVTVCDPDDPTGAKAAAARKKAGEDRKNLTANAKLLVLAKRPGKLDPYLQDCQNLKLGSIDTSCAELGRLGLEPFAGQLHRILGSPGVLVNYVDLLRIRAINELMKTHRSVVGAPLKGLPAGCDRFKSGILAAETRLTAEEKKNFDERGSPEELGKLRAEAVKVAELVRMQDKESRVPSKNCHHDGQALECVLNPDYDAAQARMRAYQARIRRELELHPLLSARDAAPRDDWDLPAVKAFVEAKPEGLAAVATDARAKISAAIAKNVAKACNDANDRGGWGQSSDSVSWIDLVRLPGLTSTTVSTPPFGVFGGLQECLKRKADEIVSAREDATMLVTVGCIAGTMMSGPFVGVPCAGIMMGMAYSEYKLADNRMRWVKECEELTANGDKALCSSQEYLDSRARYESAIEALVLNGAFAGFEAGSVLVKGAKLLRAAQLARRAQQLEEAGVELGKLELVAADVKADLADPEATVNALGEKNADPTKVHGRGNVRVAGPEVAGAADGVVPPNPKTPLPSSEAPESASPHPLGQPGWAYEIRYGQVATEYKFDELGAKLIAEPGEAELINGDKLRFAEETYRPLTIGEKAVERAERVLEQKGILKPGQKLMPYLVEDSAGNLVEAKGGTRRVYRHPTDPNKVIKVYDPEMQPGYRSRPDKIVKLMQRERAFEGYLQRFRKYGLEVVENDYSLAEYGVVIQEEVQGGVKVDEYLTRLTAGGKNAEAASFGHRLDGIRKEIEALRDDMDKLMRERYDFHFHKGGETGEKVPIDFGETKGTRRLNNCRVVDASPEPRIRCFDW